VYKIKIGVASDRQKQRVNSLEEVKQCSPKEKIDGHKNGTLKV
jgi:hypothetical protein